MSVKKFKVVTLGCRTNQYESQCYKDQMLAMGYREAMASESADVCIVNTCTVTEGADSSSRHEIRALAKRYPNAKIAVTGCLAERSPETLYAISGVSHVIGNAKKEQLLSQLFPEEEFPEFSIQKFSDHTRAFVKVQDGCNSFCTYCIIPYVRGRSRSRTIAEIVREVEGLVHNGYKEIVLTGINIGDFDGGEGGLHCLADLVRAIDTVSGVERIRLSSIDPDEVDENLMQAIIGGEHTCHCMHIVLQSGSNVILKRMNRKYTRQLFLETIQKLRSASADFTFTTDIIVGFPGETDADFEETLSVMHSTRFAKVHMFPYSERKRTRAALFSNKVPSALIAERKNRTLREAEKIAYTLREGYVGRTLSVLLESSTMGHTTNFLPVTFTSPAGEPNDLVQVELIANGPEGLLGRPL